MPERSFIDALGRDDDALRLGFAWLLDRTAGQALPGVIAVYAIDNARRLTPPFPASIVDALVRQKRVSVNQLTIELMTERQLPTGGNPLGPTLAVWVDDRRLDRIEELQPVALLAIPWRPENIADWKANYGPTDLRSGTAVAASMVANPVVVAALNSLTALVNLSSGLGHPSDRGAAVTLFHILRAGGEQFDPAEIRAWAVNNGWEHEGARELAAVAEGVLSGRRFRVERFGWSDDVLEQWRAEAISDSPN